MLLFLSPPRLVPHHCYYCILPYCCYNSNCHTPLIQHCTARRLCLSEEFGYGRSLQCGSSRVEVCCCYYTHKNQSIHNSNLLLSSAETLICSRTPSKEIKEDCFTNMVLLHHFKTPNKKENEIFVKEEFEICCCQLSPAKNLSPLIYFTSSSFKLSKYFFNVGSAAPKLT